MPEKKSSLMKKLFLIAGGFFLLLLIAVVTIPFFVNVDHYRPQIVAIANDHIRGKLELGKLKLSLWGQIKIEVDGFSLSDLSGRKVVSAKDVYFHVPFFSVFSGSPVLVFKMDRPEVNVVKDKSGKMNVLSLIPPSKTPKAEKPAEEKPKASSELPSLVVKARLGVELSKARLLYQDLATDLKTEVKDLGFLLKDISMSHPMSLAVWADLDTKMGSVVQVKGPFRLDGQIAPHFEGSEFKSADVSLTTDATKLFVQATDAFVKSPTIPMTLKVGLAASPSFIKINEVVAVFHNAEFKVAGTVDLEKGPMKLSFSSNNIELGPWADLVPMLKTYALEGSSKMAGSVGGTTTTPQYAAKIDFQKVKVIAPKVRGKPEINGGIKIVTDQIQSLDVEMKGAGTQIRMTGKLVGFSKPKFDFLVSSTSLDLDQLLDMPKTEKASGQKEGSGAALTADKKEASKEDFDKLLDGLRKNEIAAAAAGTIRFNLASLKMKGVVVTAMQGTMGLKDLNFSIEPVSLNVFGGKIGGGFSMQMAPKTPPYRLHMYISDLDLQKAVESQFALFKNTLLGKMSLKMDGTGSSLNPDPAKQNLNAKGSFQVKEGSFATIDIGKVVADSLNKSLVKVGEKVPQLRNKQVNQPAGKEAAYEVISSDFTIAGGVFSSPNFQAISKKDKGIDLKGSTKVALSDYKLEADWQIIDTHNLTKVKDISVNEGGVQVAHLLSEGGGPVRFPIKAKGTLFSPAFDYGTLPEHLATVAATNIGKAVGEKAKGEVKKRAQEELQKAAAKASPKVQEAVQGIGKKLFGH